MAAHRLSALALVAIAARIAAADPASHELATIRSQIGWGASLQPERFALTSEGGWNGAERRSTIDAVVEAHLATEWSVVAGAQYGALDTRGRPSLGIAYQLADPRRQPLGLRLSLTYKPEGFSEPGGEIESVAVVSRMIHGDALRAMVAYGRDPEGNESDVEAGASFVHALAGRLLAGGVARFRGGLVASATEPRWDAIAGMIGGARFDRVRCELLVGDDTIGLAGVHSGVVGLVSIGADL